MSEENSTTPVEVVSVEPASETVAEPTTELTKEDFERLLGEGRKALMFDNFEDACEKLGEATSLSVKLFGDFAAETYAPHFYYGKALLTLASVEKEVIESKLQDESVVQELKEGLQTLAETLAKQQETEQQEAEQQEEVKTTEDAEESMEESVKQDEEADADQTLNKEDEGGENDDEDDEDLETAQLAFESLDYARIVCEKQTDNSTLWLERQKETLILLSQVALNGDNFAAAIEDLKSALKIVDAHFPNDYREASFIHLELTRIYRKESNFSEANYHIEKSIAAFEQFKAKIQSEPKEGEPTLAEADEMLEELFDERKLTQIRENEDKENAQKQPLNTDDKPAEMIQIKRKEKRAAEDSVEDEVDLKKSKVGDVEAQV